MVQRMKSVLSAVLDFIMPSRKVIREARRLEAERKERVAAHDAAWRLAHPHLAEQGVPPPPTPDSMTVIGVRSFGGFYQP